jgi:hypothetical protein
MAAFFPPQGPFQFGPMADVGHGRALLSMEAKGGFGSRPCEKTIAANQQQFTVVVRECAIAKTSHALFQAQ